MNKAVQNKIQSRNRTGQASFMVMMMMFIAILLALFFWFSAGSDYAQNAASAARNRGDIYGRTAGDAIAVGVGRQAAGPVTGPGGFDPGAVPPVQPVPPTIPLGPAGQGGPGVDPRGGTPGGGAPPATPGANGNGVTGIPRAPRGGFVTEAPWMTQLYQALKPRLGAVPGVVLEVPEISLGTDLGNQLKNYIGVGADVPGIVLDRIEGKITNIRRDLAFSSQGLFDDKSYYREPLFGDGRNEAGPGKDVRPHDFLADMIVTYAIRSTAGGQSRTLTYTRVMDVRIADTSPVAREFAVFAYEPPHTEKYMLEDLNGPGYLAVLPNARARVLVRGPLVLRVEDAGMKEDGSAPEVGLGTQNRTIDSVNWVSNQKQMWHGFGGVPAPRAVDMPKFSFTLGDLGGAFSNLIGGRAAEVFDKPSQRPRVKKTTPYELPFPFPDFPGVWLVGITPDWKGEKINFGGALGGFAGIYQPLPPRETVALAGASAYYVGTADPGKQKFSMTGLSAEMRRGMGLTTLPPGTVEANLLTPYHGILVHTEDDTAEAAPVAVAQGGGLPVTNDVPITGNGVLKLERDDFLSAEPVYYKGARTATPGGQGTRYQDGITQAQREQAGGDQGVYGLYGIASYERTIYWFFDVPSTVRFVKNVGRAILVAVGILTVGTGLAAGLPAQAAVEAAHVAAEEAVKRSAKTIAKQVAGFAAKSVTIAAIPMNYTVEVPANPPANWQPGQAASVNGQAVDENKLTMAPYGMYYDDGTGSFADEAVRDIAMVGLSVGAQKIFQALVNKIRGRSAGLSAGADDVAKARAKEMTAHAAGNTDEAAKAGAQVEAAAAKQGQTAAAAGAQSADDIAKIADAAKAQMKNADDALRSAETALNNFKGLKNGSEHTALLKAWEKADLDHKAAKEAVKQAGTLSRGAGAAAGVVDDAVRAADQAAKAASQQVDEAARAVKAAQESYDAISGIARNSSEGIARANQLTQAKQALAAAEAAEQSAAAALSQAQAKAGAGAAGNIAETAGAQGTTGLYNRITNGWKKFVSNRLNMFRTGQMGLGKIWARFAQEMIASGFTKSGAMKYAGLGLTLALVKNIDNHFVRGHAEDTRRALKVEPTVVPVSASETRAALDTTFTKGYLPPKYRYFPNAYAFTYRSMQEYLSQFGDVNGGQIDIYINGIVRVEDLNYNKPQQKIVYRGRGVIVAVPSAANSAANPVFNVDLVRAGDDASYLTLVYEAPNVEIERDSGIGQLLMGREFTGTVVSSQGVRPADGVKSTTIHGNLVCRHLNKSKMKDDQESVIVNYVVHRMTAAIGLDQERWWSISVSPKVSGFTPQQ